jgi:beta-glucosidase
MAQSNSDDERTTAERIGNFKNKIIGTSRRRFLQVSGGVASTAALPVSKAWDGESETEDHGEDESGSDDRLRDLLDRMTVEEKVGQMVMAEVEDPAPENIKELLLDYHIGTFLNPAPMAPKELAETLNELQRFVQENTRLGIPILYATDAVHGHVVAATQTTVFPHNCNFGAARDVQLAGDTAGYTGETLRATGFHLTFSPVCEIHRDPRWGRTFETFSEDPFTAAQMVESQSCDDHWSSTTPRYVPHLQSRCSQFPSRYSLWSSGG